jgi:hypothetical protein
VTATDSEARSTPLYGRTQAKVNFDSEHTGRKGLIAKDGSDRARAPHRHEIGRVCPLYRRAG